MAKKEQGKKKKLNTRVSTRTALVYTGAAILIVVVGLRTILQTSEDGFNFVAYITMGALGIEFGVLLLYAYTIYSAGKEDARKEYEKEQMQQMMVHTTEMPQVALQLKELTENMNQAIDRSIETLNMPQVVEKIHSLSDNMNSSMDRSYHALIDENKKLQEQYAALADITSKLKRFTDGELEKTYSNLVKYSENSQKMLSQLVNSENTIQKHSEEISKFTTSLNKLIEEQISLRIRQEIQKILATTIDVK
jgi:hypothetical protein